ncbi:MAG TPA: ABC transporter permease [Acidobacteriaceae bacterium]|nr:ABC transporter permease [Acidobacteriaceae bacterium]
MLRNTLLIAKREYLERVRSRVFRITTILVPIGMGGIALLGGLGGKRMEAGLQNLAVVSNSPVLAQQVKASLENREHGPKSVQVFAPATDADLSQLNQRVANREIQGYLTLNTVPGQTLPTATWTSGSSTDFIGKTQMQGAVSDGLVRQELLTRGLTEDQINALTKEIKVSTSQVKNGVVVKSDTERSFAGAYVLILVLYGSVLIYGINIARSVVEEKTSRIFEVLLSTASPDDLMMGKLLGVGATGLTQLAIWTALAVAVGGSALAQSQGIHGISSMGLTNIELLYFPVFFIGGFYLYSALAAALGSSVSAEQEVQQFSFILVSPLVVSVVMMVYVMQNPSSTASVVMSLLPPFTPIIMYMRICAQMPPMWQVWLSIALLAASVWGMVWLSARIYRVGVLMYGKRATLPEMLRWLRYS